MLMPATRRSAERAAPGFSYDKCMFLFCVSCKGTALTAAWMLMVIAGSCTYT